jgi:peptide/nickel transport system substrate-binding protein
MDPATASSGAWIFNDKVDPATGFTAVNDSTFRLRLIRPFHPILGILSMPYCSVVPHEAVERYGRDFRRHPCGTGPFCFKYWDEGQALILVRNPHYFERDSQGRRLPYLDALKFTFVSSKATEFLLFMQGQLDYMKNLDVSYKDEIVTKSGKLKQEFRGKVILSKKPFLNTEYLGFLVDTTNPLIAHSPVRLKKFRLAVNYGFDRAKIAMYLKNDVVTPAYGGFVPAGLPAFDSTRVRGYRYDPEKARRLLKEAGFPEGRGLPAVTLSSTEQYADIANFVASQLQEIGIHVNVNIEQIGMLREMAAKSRAPFFRADWMADYPDAESFLTCFYGKNPAPPNYSRFSNPLFDHLYEKALAENRDSARYRLYQRMDSIVVANAPVVPVYYDESVVFLHPWVKGFVNNSMALLDLRRVRIVKSR